MKIHTKFLRLVAPLVLALAACDAGSGKPPPTQGSGPLYAVAYDVNAPDGTWTGYLGLHDTLALGTVDTSAALELPGNPSVMAALGSIFVASDELKTITRYDVVDGRFVERGTLSLVNEGMPFLYDADIVSDTQAFNWNGATFELVEWNPTSMTITRRHDLSGLKREDFGMEWRAADAPMYRAQDGVLFYYVAYTTQRTTYANALHVVLFDTRSGEWKLLKDERCGESAGFGGWMVENGDAYLFSDNFGSLAEILAGIRRPSCLLRVKAGERTFDANYLLDLNALLGGKQAWGLYYAGNGKAYTAALDMGRKGEFNHPYNFLFADIHPFFRVDVEAGTATQVTAMQPAGVGWNPFRIGDKLYMPRTTGRFTQVGNWESAESALWELNAETNEAVELFRVPGTPSLVTRLR